MLRFGVSVAQTGPEDDAAIKAVLDLADQLPEDLRDGWRIDLVPDGIKVTVFGERDQVMKFLEDTWPIVQEHYYGQSS